MHQVVRFSANGVPDYADGFFTAIYPNVFRGIAGTGYCFRFHVTTLEALIVQSGNCPEQTLVDIVCIAAPISLCVCEPSVRKLDYLGCEFLGTYSPEIFVDLLNRVANQLLADLSFRHSEAQPYS